MDRNNYYTMQPQQAPHQSYQTQTYQSQTQQRVATNFDQQHHQYQYGYNAPQVRVQADVNEGYKDGSYSAKEGVGAGVTLQVNANSNTQTAQFENQPQVQLQRPRRQPAAAVAATNLQLLTVPGATNGAGSRGSDQIDGGSVCASSNCGVPEHITSEDEYRTWLTSNFKHRFAPYESQHGMPLKEFTEMADMVNFKRRHNLQGLFKRLDMDGNQRVSWDEFFNGMKYTKKSEVSKTKRAINTFIENMTPAAKNKIKKDKMEAEKAEEPIPEESYLEAYNCRPPPLFIPLFYVAVWIFFIIYAVELQKGPEWNRVGWDVGFPYYSPLVFCPSVRHQAWRFLSYMFLHNGYHHIVFNTILSLLLGIPLESVHKFWRVGPVFLIGVVIGSMASSIADPSTMLIGASGGVYALIGAHYALVLMNWEELQDDWLNMRSNPLKFLLSGVMRLIYLTLLMILDFGITFYGRYSGSQTLPVSVAAHIGGLLAGFFSGVPILRNIDKKPWEGKLAIVCLVITCLMFLFGILWNIFYKNYPAADILICSNPNLANTYG